MNPSLERRGGLHAVSGAVRLAKVVVPALLLVGLFPAFAQAGKLSWLDEVVQEVIIEARAGGKRLVRGGDGAATEIRGAGRLFLTHDADETLEHLVRRSDELARAGRRVEQPAEALLQARFSRLLKQDPQALRTFTALEPAEKRLVVELGETAQLLARRYPREAETMVRRLGPEGLTAVRVFGDDVAEVLVKEGPESLSVLRKAGRGGWSFFTRAGPAPQEKTGRRGRAGRFSGQPREVRRLRRPGHRVRRPGIRQGRHPARLGCHRRRGPGTRNHDRPHAGSLRTRLSRAPLPRHGAGRTGRHPVPPGLVGLPVRWMFRPFGFILRPFASAVQWMTRHPQLAARPPDSVGS